MESKTSTPLLERIKRRKPTRSIGFFLNDNESISIELVDEEEAIKTCVLLTKAGYGPVSLYRLDKNGDGMRIAEFELIK